MNSVNKLYFIILYFILFSCCSAILKEDYFLIYLFIGWCGASSCRVQGASLMLGYLWCFRPAAATPAPGLLRTGSPASVSAQWASYAADLWHIFTKLCKYMLNLRPFRDLKTERNELILMLPESIPALRSTYRPVRQTSQTDANLTHLVHLVCRSGVRWSFRTVKYFKSSMCKY